jgi:hypothetical protein
LPRGRNIFDVDIASCFDSLDISRAKTPLASNLNRGDDAAFGPKPDCPDRDLKAACYFFRTQEHILVFVHCGLEVFTLPGRNGYFIENRCFSVRQR